MSSTVTCWWCPRARTVCRWMISWRARKRCIPDRKSTRLNSSHANISYAVFCLKKKKKKNNIILEVESKKKTTILPSERNTQRRKHDLTFTQHNQQTIQEPNICVTRPTLTRTA